MKSPHSSSPDSAKGLSSHKKSSSAMRTPKIDHWSAPSQLEAPADDGFHHYRWAAESVMGNETPQNIQAKIRQGYERVRIDELPEDFLVEEDKGDGYARTGGLILMRIPLEFVEQRRGYYRTRSEEALRSADLMQGVAGRDAVREDRGTRTLEGAEAGRAIAEMSRS